MAGIDAPDVTADYLAMRRDVGAVEVARDVVRASGPDATSFLQGQLSQDVAALAEGGSAWTLLLEPQGKLVAWARLSRLGPDEVVIDVDGGWGEVVVARLERFKLRTRCDLEPLADWRAVALRGPRTGEVAAAATATATVAADPGWPGVDGLDLLGPDVVVPDGVRRCGPEAYEALRVEAGVPAMGAELVEGLIPAEAGIVERSVSWTKGCYTGQELVARIDSRGGNTPRRLVGVVVARNVLPPPGATLHDGNGKQVGQLTSVAESLDRHAPVALAYLHRSVGLPAELTVRWPGGEAPARAEGLPLV